MTQPPTTRPVVRFLFAAAAAAAALRPPELIDVRG
eukprot:CAMPEP_0182559330 /NCGR_PEP_ID=MMETSP1324-20130603/2497_1 /TAXON_ID=236786 /ORGANISM="Florenciella sp., Strain RCC1587" /LENGTH=34 /DNA_ID= /DNA_START= /DNA_END= /DNA_ORIENTATION=